MSLLKSLRKETANLEAIKVAVDSKVMRDKERMKKKLSKYIPQQAPKKLSREEKSAQYHDLRRKCFEKIAERFINDSAGQEAYKRSPSAYTVVGKYRISPDFIDYDHALRDINTIPDERERNKAIKKLAQKLGIRAK